MKKRKKKASRAKFTKVLKPLFSKSKKKVETSEETNPVASDPFKVKFP